MARFAAGKNAFGISDRSGFRYRLKDMRKEWNGSLVGPDEYEAKHPQLEPSYHSADAQALPWTRPARQEPMTVFVGLVGDSAFQSNGMQPAEQSRELLIGSSIGKVTVVIS